MNVPFILIALKLASARLSPDHPFFTSLHKRSRDEAFNAPAFVMDGTVLIVEPPNLNEAPVLQIMANSPGIDLLFRGTRCIVQPPTINKVDAIKLSVLLHALDAVAIDAAHIVRIIAIKIAAIAIFVWHIPLPLNKARR